MKYTILDSAMTKDPFAARVEAGMLDRGLTLRGLCREVGLDPSFFSKVLSGRRSPPSEESVLRRIAQVLGLDPIELVVSAGRIPSEWRSLCDDPGLLREIHSRTTGAAFVPGPALSKRTVPAQRPVFRMTPKPFSEELL